MEWQCPLLIVADWEFYSALIFCPCRSRTLFARWRFSRSSSDGKFYDSSKFATPQAAQENLLALPWTATAAAVAARAAAGVAAMSGSAATEE